MTQATVQTPFHLTTSGSSVSTPPITLPTNCHNCPLFKDYKENRGRGWCQLFNRVSFSHHPFTRDCQLQRVDEEDKLRSEYSEGDKVKLIDSTKDHLEWTNYIVIGKKHNPNRYRNSKTYLSQTDWYYLLATFSQPNISQIWVYSRIPLSEGVPFRVRLTPTRGRS